jgi:hypothetical protein
MSFAVQARRIRNTDLPHPQRISALRSCVQMYHPLGFHATLSFLEQLAGRYEKDEQALQRALTVLSASREQWKKAVTEYAKTRREAKSRGERTPRRTDPNPNHTPPHWYGAARYGALHALAFRQFRGLLPPADDDVAADVRTLVAHTLSSGGDLPPADCELLTDLTAELQRRARTTRGEAGMRALHLCQVAQFIAVASR